jgi:hypothetical protein
MGLIPTRMLSGSRNPCAVASHSWGRRRKAASAGIPICNSELCSILSPLLPAPFPLFQLTNSEEK